ncbi:D-alanyl-D-alanine carboxypeptidase DacB precursor [Peptococcaceae bacterium CEB3]|nr:D-alanyl-D-alanine carboxypeptidase DacB precursor [Peptococcaceae bacterium CEB3]
MFKAMRTLAAGCVFLCLTGFLTVMGPAAAFAAAAGGQRPSAATQQGSQKLSPQGSERVSPQSQASPPKPSVSSQPADSLRLSADAAVLMDAETGDVLYAKNTHKRRAPASTTKIMTAILGLELGKPDEIVTVSAKAAQVGEATLHLDPGEKLTLDELITGALVKSGNDACVAIAEQIAGSEAEFVRLMNEKALLLGATDTHFTNPNGLPDKNHYSSAYDLALMARYGLRIPAFAAITRLKETEIHFLQPDVIMDLRNTNKLLWNYPYADGVKTGTTNAAGKCLVASATKEGRRLVAVVLNAPDRFGDARKLLEWGFDRTETTTLAQAGQIMGDYPVPGTTAVPAFAAHAVRVSLSREAVSGLSAKVVWDRPPRLPLQAGEVVGRYEVWLGKQKLRSVPLLSERAVSKDWLGRIR